MKNSWKIFLRDLQNIRNNWVAMVIICGLIVLPSLYAWFNIKASWDPYSQTDQIPVGIVNDDIGAEVRGQSIHVGDELITTLKENDSFAWHFVDYEEVMDKVDYGDFYAAIVIPKDFSEQLSTVIENEPEKATVEYYVNEKINAISPKITEKGASVIVEQISSQFISTVNGVIFEVFNDIGIEIEQELPDIRQIEQYIFDIEEKLPDLYDTLNNSLRDANDALEMAEKAEDQLPKITQLTEQSISVIDGFYNLLDETKDKIDDISEKANEEIESISETIQNMDQFIQDLEENPYNTDFLEEIENLEEKIDQGIDLLSELEEYFEVLIDRMEDEEQREQIETIDENLTELKATLETISESFDSFEEFFDEHEEDIQAYITAVQDKTDHIISESKQIKDHFRDSLQPKAMTQLNDIQQALVNVKEKIQSVEKEIPKIEEILSHTKESLLEGEDLLEHLMKEYPFIHNKVENLSDRIRKAKEETDIHEIIDLLKNDPEAEKNFFAEPVVLKENRIYPVENYGMGMTPFYTVLAMWVGVVLLVSLLSVDINEQESFTTRNIYFGRLFTFLLITILQTIIVTIGDITFIGVEASSPLWFVLFGVIISIVFTIVIYTVVSVFGDVGKAIAIIMLVLQIASSGGTYPVVLLPKFFQFIHPILPFTYAVDLMREAVGGIIWTKALKNIAVLFLMGISFIVFAMFAKEPFNKRSKKLMEKSKEAGLFQ